MEDPQHDIRGTDDSAAPRHEEPRHEESATATVARLLANPRRIRRN
jgi:hypothetical protein